MHDPVIAPLDHPGWGRIVAGEIKPDYRCFALKLMMIRVRIAHDRNPGQRDILAAEVRGFFVTNYRFAAADHAALFPEFQA